MKALTLAGFEINFGWLYQSSNLASTFNGIFDVRNLNMLPLPRQRAFLIQRDTFTMKSVLLVDSELQLGFANGVDFARQIAFVPMLKEKMGKSQSLNDRGAVQKSLAYAFFLKERYVLDCFFLIQWQQFSMYTHTYLFTFMLFDLSKGPFSIGSQKSSLLSAFNACRLLRIAEVEHQTY